VNAGLTGLQGVDGLREVTLELVAVVAEHPLEFPAGRGTRPNLKNLSNPQLSGAPGDSPS
jgi:hypothetical protein